MSILSFKYQYLDYQKLNGDCTVLIDTDQAQFNGSRSVTIAGAPVTMYEIYANGHIYGSTTDNPDPNTCCDGSNVYQNAPAVTYPTEDISDYEVLVHVPGTPADPDGEIKKIPVSELLTNPFGNIAYVSKQYTGVAAVKVTGLTLAGISSTNAGYNKQLSNALINSEMYPFPDPWSARNALLDAIAAGKIKKGMIVVRGGEEFTVGSDDPTKNGDTAGVAANATTPDIAFSATNNTTVASLLQNKIHVYFEPGSWLRYINCKYSIYAFYTLGPVQGYVASISGYGNIECIYGGLQGFEAVCCYISNSYAEISITFANLVTNTGTLFDLFLFKTLNIQIDTINAAVASFFRFHPYALATDSGDGTCVNLNIKVKNAISSINFKYPNNQGTSRNILFFKAGGLNLARLKNYKVEIDNIVTECFRTTFFDSDNFTSDGTFTWQNWTFDCIVNNAIFRKNISDVRTDLGGIGGQSTATYCTLNFYFKNIITDSQLYSYNSLFAVYTSSNSNHNKLLLKCDNCYRTANFDTTGVFHLNSAAPGATAVDNLHVFDGNYTVDPACSAAIIPATMAGMRYLIKGIYIIKAAKPVVNFNGTNGKITFSDCIFLNDGTVAPINAVAGSKAVCKNVAVPLAVSANFTPLGEALKIFSDLVNYM